MSAPSKSRNPARRGGRPKTEDGSRLYVAALATSADPSSAFTNLTLPKGAKVGVFASKKTLVEQIRRASKGRFGQAETVVSARKPRAESLVEADAFKPDARARALLRGVAIAKDTLRVAGGAYELEQVRQLLHGVSRQAVDKQVSEGRLLAVPGPSNRRSYPTIQFNDDGSVVDGLKDVIAALPTRNGWGVLHFLVGQDSRLNDERPIDLLKAGAVERVVESAKRMGEQGA